MHITNLEEYGIRCALQLARHQSASAGQAVQVSKIAKEEGLSTDYVAKIMQLFRKVGLIHSTRGTRGGFALSAPPEEISLREVFRALKTKKEKEVEDYFCQSFTGTRKECVHNCDCPLRPVWNHLFGFFDDVLGQITLADLTSKEKNSDQIIKEIAQKQAQKIVSHYKD